MRQLNRGVRAFRRARRLAELAEHVRPILTRISGLISHGVPPWHCTSRPADVPIGRVLDLMELEDRTLFSATPAAGGLAIPQDTPPISTIAPSQASATADTVQHGQLPLSFQSNQGQTSSQVDFVARGDGYNVFLTKGDAVLTLQTASGGDALRIDLVGANPNPAANGQSPQAGQANYLLGNDRNNWITGVPLYGSVEYQNVYQGIGIRYYGNQQQLEYDFNVAAGANPSQIRLSFDGSQSLSLDVQGNLIVTMPGSEVPLVFHAPMAYQETSAGQQAVASSYTIDANGQVGFALGSYDTSRPLVIDPLLDYGTFLGGTNDELANGVALDAAGNAYLVGQTKSNTFPTTVGVLDTSFSNGSDIFVTKLNATGTGIVYSTYVGGNNEESAQGVTVDSAGDAYVTGYTKSNNFPTFNAWQSAINGGQDGFLLKLNPSGASLAYSTYFGGSGSNDVGNSIALDSAGNAYITGSTDSNSGIATAGAYQTTLSGGQDAYWAEFNTTQSGPSSLVYSTYFGGHGDEWANAIALGPTGDVFIGGESKDNQMPVTAGAFQSTPADGQDSFLSVFSGTSPHTLLYSTYLGGNGGDAINGLAVDASNRAYVTGFAGGNQFPVTAGAYQTTYGGGGNDAFVAELDPSLNGAASLIYSTFVGGNGNDQASGIALGAGGTAQIVGSTNGAFPVTADALQRTDAGGNDGFYAVVGPGGATLNYSTYLGGKNEDYATSIAVSPSGLVNVAGYTQSTTLSEITPGAYDTTANGGKDAFVVQLSINNAPMLSGANNFAAINEDQQNNPGTLVSSLIAGQVNDPDAGAVQGIAIVGVDSTDGVWQYSTNGGQSWVGAGSPTQTAALLLAADAQTYVRFVPSLGWHGTVASALTFRAWDQTTGTAGSVADTSINGGATAFSSATASAAIAVNFINHAPMGADNSVTTSQGVPYTFGTANFVFSDPNDNPPNSFQGVTINNVSIPLLASLTANGLAVSNGQFVSAATIAAGQLVFTPALLGLGANYASFQFQVQDDGGTANGGANTDATLRTMSINVVSNNTAPTLSGSNNLSGINENASNSSGDLVSSLIVGQVSDPDAGAVSGIAVTGVDNTNGTWQYSTNSGATWTAIGAPSPTSALLLAADNFTSVRFVPNADWSGTVTSGITFQAWDQTSGTVGTTANVTTSGGSTAFSAAQATAGITVTHVNQPPVGSNSTTTLLENTSYSFTAADFHFSDPNDSPPNNLLAVQIVTLPTLGALTDNGLAVTAGQSIPLVDITSGLLTFAPIADSSGTQYSTYAFRVEDDGGTANGGVDTDPTARTMTLNVTWVNQAPAGANNTISTSQNTPYAFAAADFGFTDPADAPPNNLLAVKITSLPAAGTLTDNGVAVTVGQFVTVTDINAGNLVFTPAANTSGNNYGNFTFQVQDNGGTANGGVDLDPAPKTMTVNVVWVNHAPSLSGANSLSAINQNDTSSAGTPVSSIIAGQASDVDVGTSLGIAVVAVDNTNGAWQYSTNAGSSWTNFGAPSITTSRLLAADAATFVRFVPATNWSGMVAGGVTFHAWDGTSGTAGGTANASATGGSTAFSVATANAGIVVNAPPAPAPAPANPAVPPLNASNLLNATSGATNAVVTTSAPTTLALSTPTILPAPSPAPEVPSPPPVLPRAATTTMAPMAIASPPVGVISLFNPSFAVPSIVSGIALDDARTTATKPTNPVRPVVVSNRAADSVFAYVAAALEHDLDEMDREIQAAGAETQLVVGSVLAASSSLTVGYIIWMLRGGMLLSSMIAQMPAWRRMDPLVVLSRLDNEKKEPDAEPDESLQSILAKSKESLSTGYEGQK